MRELSLHILDLVQNSLVAQAQKVSIKLTENSLTNRLQLEVADDGRGMDEEQLKKALDPFYTTRTTRRVGLGLSLLEASARQCGGGITIVSSPGKGTVVRAEFELNHIDRVPVGDMVSTMLALISGSPEVDFSYVRCCDDKSFVFETSKIKEVLGGVPLNHPDVLSWLKDFLTEKEKEVANDII